MASCLRGIFSAEEEQLETFRDGVPVFDTIGEAVDWARAHATYGSNPDDTRLRHTFTHLIGWKQVETVLLPKLAQLSATPMHAGGEEYYYTTPVAEAAAAAAAAAAAEGGEEAEATAERRQNRAVSNFEFKPVVAELERRLALSHHRLVNFSSTMHTLRYLFFHMRCGVMVVIRNNRLAVFAPFVNHEYTNTWGHKLQTDPADFDEYYRLKRKFYRAENIIPDKTKWWANGNIICNEHHSPREKHTQWWGDNLLAPFKHMLETLCRERLVPDVELFFNKRDHPQLKANLTEPYDFVMDEQDAPLPREKYGTYAPIMSFYCSPKFSDLPVPTTEDWESAMGKVFPPSFIPDSRSGKISEPRDLYLKSNFERFHVDWEAKVDTAFFRGNATGGGTTPETNQRIHIAQLCLEWNSTGRNGSPPLLDAGITNYNVRDKKLLGQPMRYTMKSKLGVPKASFVEMYKQGTYKYILYIEGHCAANRYSFLMRLGSVILKVESKCEASEMWFFPLLRPHEGDGEVGTGAQGADHVPVKADLSDLREKIEWCRANDDKCRQIAENARAKYQRCLTKESILDYLQMVMVKSAKCFEHAPSWWAVPQALAPKPHKEPPRKKCARDKVTGQFVHCAWCRRDLARKCKNNGDGSGGGGGSGSNKRRAEGPPEGAARGGGHQRR